MSKSELIRQVRELLDEASPHKQITRSALKKEIQAISPEGIPDANLSTELFLDFLDEQDLFYEFREFLHQND